eukprot:1463085-Pleurochrysis_carterae.AAC.1
MRLLPAMNSLRADVKRESAGAGDLGANPGGRPGLGAYAGAASRGDEGRLGGLSRSEQTIEARDDREDGTHESREDALDRIDAWPLGVEGGECSPPLSQLELETLSASSDVVEDVP